MSESITCQKCSNANDGNRTQCWVCGEVFRQGTLENFRRPTQDKSVASQNSGTNIFWIMASFVGILHTVLIGLSSRMGGLVIAVITLVLVVILILNKDDPKNFLRVAWVPFFAILGMIPLLLALTCGALIGVEILKKLF